MKLALPILFFFFLGIHGSFGQANNPIIYADVPDLSMIRVGEVYYMSSTTMHMSPGLPIMKSTDLVNWELIRYGYDRLEESSEMNLLDGKHAYGKGSWASSLRYHEGTYYLSTFAQNTGKTHIYTTANLETGAFKATSFSPDLHDHTLVFDEGKVYMIWGAGQIKIVELNKDLSGIIPNTERILIENATLPTNKEVGLPAEGSQLFKINGKYYLFHIAWPKGGMRSVIVHRADALFGPYEGRLVLEDKGVAQGGLIDTPNGDWFAYLFRDFGAVGRIPYLVPVTWEDGWPVLGQKGEVPIVLNLPANQSLIPRIVASDDFKRGKDDPELPLVWQWNHNPVDKLWTIDRKKDVLKLTTDRIDPGFLTARNTLTQRTIGPKSMGTVRLKISKLNEGDMAGLALLQQDYGFIGVANEGGQNKLVMKRASGKSENPIAQVKLKGKDVLLRAICDFTERKDEAIFLYSLDKGKSWQQLGDTLPMKYTLPHFMGYRFGLFYYSTAKPGGEVAFDFFEITDQVPKKF
jgi:beta-xylosidase